MIKRLAHTLGMDRAIAYTSSARLIQAVGGVLSMLLVATCLSEVEQGFFYTFYSILAIQVFFELGLGGIITQFVAHEKAHLTERDNTLEGEEKYRSRLAYLLRFCLKWYTILAGALLVVVWGIGTVFFTRFYQTPEPVVWHGPWLLLVLGTTANFLIAPVSAFLEGLGKVRQVAFVRMLQQSTMMTLLCVGLLSGLKLYAASYIVLISAAIFLIYAGKNFYPLLRHIYRTPVVEKISYRTEIFPYQWRIATSWISGYFIYQLFNPVLGATEGPVAAGQMGMTLAGLNAIQSFALSWLTTKIPTMSGLIAQKNYPGLDSLFGRTLRQSMLVNIAFLICFVAVVAGLRHFDVVIAGHALGERFLPTVPMIFMAATIVLNLCVFAMATYLRCHKQEPFMWQSVTIGAACLLSTLLFGYLYGMMGIVVGYFILMVLGFFWARAIYFNKKNLWHR